MWWIIIALFVVVIVTRNVFNVFGERFKSEGRLAQALDFAPLAALTAIVVPEFARAVEQLGASAQAHLIDGRLASGLVLLIVGLVTRNPLYGLLCGAAAYGALHFGGSYLLPILFN